MNFHFTKSNPVKYNPSFVGSLGAEKNAKYLASVGVANGEGNGLKTSEQEVEWLQVSVNATTDAR